MSKDKKKELIKKYSQKKIKEFIPNLNDEQYDLINELIISVMLDFYHLGKDGYEL